MSTKERINNFRLYSFHLRQSIFTSCRMQFLFKSHGKFLESHFAAKKIDEHGHHVLYGKEDEKYSRAALRG